MSFGLLEAGLVSAGLAGGYSLGSKLRQVLQEASAADGQHQRVGDAAKRGAREGGSLSQLPSSLASRWVGNEEAMTLTVMLVGEPGAGKTLLCERLAAEDGIVGRETLPRTLAPQWHAVQLDLPSVGRVSVQLLDTPGGLPEVSVLQANRPSSHLTHSQATPVTHPPALCPCSAATAIGALLPRRPGVHPRLRRRFLPLLCAHEGLLVLGHAPPPLPHARRQAEARVNGCTRPHNRREARAAGDETRGGGVVPAAEAAIL